MLLSICKYLLHHSQDKEPTPAQHPVPSAQRFLVVQAWGSLCKGAGPGKVGREKCWFSIGFIRVSFQFRFRVN